MKTATQGNETSHLVDGQYGILDLVDIKQLQVLFEQFSDVTGFTIALLDHPDMNMLLQTGWKEVCTEFHRAHPSSNINCQKSNHRLLDDLNEAGVVVVDRCDNGLVDCATPIVIEGKHIASLATGQMLLEKPDIEFFRRQSRTFGFDEKAYLQALSLVEVVSEQKLKSATGFLGALAQMVTESGYSRLKFEKEVMERARAEAAQRDAEDRFRLIFEKSSEAIVFGWADGRVDFANEAAHQLFGLSDEELRAATRTTLVDPADPRLAVALKERNRRGAYRCELNYIRKDGSIRPAEVVSTIFAGKDGELRSSTMFRDVSDRYERERILLETITALRLRDQALGAISQGVLITGADRRITYANDAFTRITGYSLPEIAGLSCSILGGPQTSVETIEQLRAALSSTTPFHGEILNYRKDGSTFWNELSITPVFNETGELTQFVGVQRDITKRKAAELSLRESRGLITTFFDSLDDMVAVIDAQGTILMVNRAWRDFAKNNGATQALIDAVGVNYLEVLEPSHNSALDVAIARRGIECVLAGTLPRFEQEYPCHSPEEKRFFNMRVFPLSGPRKGVLIAHEDISEKKQIEQERVRDAQKLTTLSKRLVAVQEENRKRLASELHDRTSPNLAAIGINMDVTELALKERDWSTISLRMSDNRGLIEDTAASIREICADLRPPALDYAGLVPAIEGYAAQFSWRTGVAITIERPDSARRLTPELESIVFRIFQEAMTNIAKHASATSASVSLCFDTQHLSLSVIDNGLGFDAENLALYSGQGLINMREMTEFFGGTIHIQSSPGNGTRIVVNI